MKGFRMRLVVNPESEEGFLTAVVTFQQLEDKSSCSPPPPPPPAAAEAPPEAVLRYCNSHVGAVWVKEENVKRLCCTPLSSPAEREARSGRRKV